MNEERGERRRECKTDAKMRGVDDKQRKGGRDVSDMQIEEEEVRELKL